jgi:hypothetical protein
VKRLESTAPLATPTLRSEAGPTLTAVRGTAALCAVIALWMAVREGLPWPFAVVGSLFLGGLSAGDLIRIGRHVVIGFEPVIRVDLNGDGVIGAPRVVKELVYVGGVEPPAEVLDTGQGIAAPDDLRYFIDHLGAIDAKGPTVRDWLGQTLPSGITVEADDFTALVTPLVNIRAIVGRGERTPGKVKMTKAEIKRRLNL